MRLGFWQKSVIFLTAAAVGFSGLLWFVLHDVMSAESDEMADIAHLLLVLHGVSSYALLLAVGSLLPVHVRTGWQRRRNLTTGLTVSGAIAILGATALVLYYGGEEMHAPAKWLHLIFGFACLALFPAHAFLGEKSPAPAAAGDGASVPAPPLTQDPDQCETAFEKESLGLDPRDHAQTTI
jgi:hypothetical protein